MNSEQRARIVISQKNALRRNGYHPNALFWSNQAVQEKRFEILMDIGVKQNNTVLDIGCGFGDFAGFLKQQKKPVHYTGIDISNDLLIEGRSQNSHLENFELIEADIFEYNPLPRSFDYVTLSGALNRKFMGNSGVECAKDYSLNVIEQMLKISKIGIAFNLLDARHKWTAERWDLQSFHPDEISQFIQPLTRNFKIIDGYLENDFTVYAWQE